MKILKQPIFTSAMAAKNDIKFTNDMQMLAEIIGNENTIKVIANLSGISIYIPKPDYAVIRYFYELQGGNVKRTAQQLGVSERMVYRAVKNEAGDGQLTIYDELAKHVNAAI
jgi:hypothetical protein